MEFYNSDIATDPSIELIQFNADRTKEKAVAWAKDLDMPWPVVMRENHKDVESFTALGFRSLPSYALLTKDGELVEKSRDYKALTKKAKELVAEAAE